MGNEKAADNTAKYEGLEGPGLKKGKKGDATKKEPKGSHETRGRP